MPIPGGAVRRATDIQSVESKPSRRDASAVVCCFATSPKTLMNVAPMNMHTNDSDVPIAIALLSARRYGRQRQTETSIARLTSSATSSLSSPRSCGMASTIACTMWYVTPHVSTMQRCSTRRGLGVT